MRKIRRILEKCLVVDVKERPDFIEILRETIGNGEEGKEKIKFYIKLSQMNKEECQELFENDEKKLLKEEVNQLREKNIMLNIKLEEIRR